MAFRISSSPGHTPGVATDDPPGKPRHGHDVGLFSAAVAPEILSTVHSPGVADPSGAVVLASQALLDRLDPPHPCATWLTVICRSKAVRGATSRAANGFTKRPRTRPIPILGAGLPGPGHRFRPASAWALKLLPEARGLPPVVHFPGPTEQSVNPDPALLDQHRTGEMPKALVAAAGDEQLLGAARPVPERREFQFHVLPGDPPGRQPIGSIVVPVEFLAGLVPPAGNSSAIRA